MLNSGGTQQTRQPEIEAQIVVNGYSPCRVATANCGRLLAKASIVRIIYIMSVLYICRRVFS